MALKRVNTASLLVILSLIPALAFPDVFFTDKGAILIGTIVKSATGTTTILDRGNEKSIPSASILRSEPSTDALKDLPVTIELMDGSLIRGKISDFDADIGIFLDISFGVLTIPNQSVKTVIDPAQRRLYAGPPAHALLGASYYFPVFGANADFGPALRAEGSADWALPGLRGANIGFDASYSFTDFIPSDLVDYSFTSLQPTISYRWLDARLRKDFLKILTPFASIGAGPAYVLASQPGTYPERIGELTVGALFKAGVDIDAFKGLGLRVQGRADVFFQQGAPFTTLSVGALFSYDF
jgi:hypothetical protein